MGYFFHSAPVFLLIFARGDIDGVDFHFGIIIIVVVVIVVIAGVVIVGWRGFVLLYNRLLPGSLLKLRLVDRDNGCISIFSNFAPGIKGSLAIRHR